MKLYIYKFEDGTHMEIIKSPLYMREILMLEDLHGYSTSEMIEIKKESEE